jgi:hypothetical protein
MSIYSINFQTHASENPLSDGGNWSTSTLQIANNECYGTGGSGAAGNGTGSAVLSGPTLPVDQYAQFTLGSLSGVGVSIRMSIRDNGSSNNTGFFRLTLNANGSWALSEWISGSLTQVASGTTTFQSGDVFSLFAQGTLITVAQNQTILTTYTDLTGGSSSTKQVLTCNAPTTGNVAAVFAYTAGAGNPLVYSQPDCRTFGNFPNKSRTVNGTSIYDVQTSSNPAVPGTDSRTAGAPVDSRVNKPTNSRTPGTFGPGE